MEEKKVTVIVPIYHVEQYLKKCVESIRNQTYRNLEIILVDDGGDDGCPAMCDEYAGIDERIRVVHKTNGGLSDARNAGMAIATGDYVAYADSDDYLMENAYERMVARMEETGADIAVCNFLCVDAEGNPISERNGAMDIRDGVISGTQAIRNLSGPHYEYWTTAWNRMYRREIAEIVPFPKGRLHEDEFTAHQFFSQAQKVVGIEKPLYCYVIRDNSIMTKKFSARNLDYVDALDLRIAYCMEHEELVETGKALLRWMPQYLLRSHKKLDLSLEENRKRYAECVATYENEYDTYRKLYSLGIKQTLITLLLRYAPGIGEKVVG